MELCPYGTLTSHFQKGKLSSLLKSLIALDAAKGIQIMHENNILHRDLKV